MANIVEFIVKIRDLASSPMRAVGAAAEGTMSRIARSAGRTSSSITDLNSRIDALTKTRDISLNLSQIRQANREIQQLEGRRDRLQNAGRTQSMSTLGKAAVFGGVALLGAGLHTSVKSGMDRQMAGTSFEVMAGKKDGDKLHKNLMSFATDTIYGNEVFGEAKTMLGFGVAAKNVMPAMKMLGDIAMGNAEHMQALSLAFSQTTAAGRLMGQDLLQYVNAGFNPLQAISEKTGRSMADLKKDVEKGKISVIDVANAMQYATGPMGRFHNGMQKIGETPTGKILAFQGAMETLAGTIGMRLLPALGGIIDMFNWMGDHTEIMYGVAAAVGVMTGAWALYTAWTQRAAIWQGILAVVAFWPIAVIGVVVGLAVWAAKSFDGWGKSIQGLWTIVKLFVSDVGIGFKIFFQTVVYEGELFYLKIKSVFEYIGGVIANIAKAMKLALSGDFGGAKKALTMEIKTNADSEIEKLKTGHAADRAANKAQLEANKKAMAAAWGQVGLSKVKPNKKEDGAGSYLNGKFDFSKGPGVPAGVADSAKGIAGGGVRNITINIAKQGVDVVNIHTATLKEGAKEIENLFVEMFNQVVNSGTAMLPAN